MFSAQLYILKNTRKWTLFSKNENVMHQSFEPGQWGSGMFLCTLLEYPEHILEIHFIKWNHSALTKFVSFAS